jgi:hypothetical protein
MMEMRQLETKLAFLDSQNPTAGTITISDIYDTNYLRSTTEISITIDGWSDNTGIETYFMGIGSSGDEHFS